LNTEERISFAVGAAILSVVALGMTGMMIGAVALTWAYFHPLARVVVTLLAFAFALAFWWIAFLYGRDAIRG
jgi:protein-S-isoprenylcysteine O-methyltransferase Ste14